MKISGENQFVKANAYVNNVRDKEKAESSSGQTTQVSTEDSVVLSPKAKEIQQARKLLEEVPDIREEKVARLKEQIENGTYEIDAKKIAAKMIRESLLNESF